MYQNIQFYCAAVLLSFFTLMTTQVQATQVPLEKAEAIAKTTFAMKSMQKFKSAAEIKMTNVHTQMVEGAPAYYIFNVEPKGFVVVSAEDEYNPILAFSDESIMHIDNEEMMGPIFGTLVQHEQHIEYIRKNDYKPAPHIINEWEYLNNATVESFSGKMDPEGMVVAPLTTTTWNQGEFYNSFTPADADPEAINGRTYCGCAPIALAQLVKYHNYPPRGNGQNTYEDPQYGTLTADFCRDYNWTNMPDSLSEENNDVAEFIYHIGVSTNTEYSITYTSTFVSYIRDALVNFWNYDESANWFYDADGDFARVAIADLNQGRPVLLTGEAYSNGVFEGAHAWVADGYGYFLDPDPNQPEEYFHFNWGWGGDNNGWFLDSNGSWAPIPFSSGIRPITYYWERYVVHNVFPAENMCGAPKSLYTTQVTPFRANLNTDYVPQYTQVVNFRYREVGTADWVVLNPLSSYVSGTMQLEPDTEYEFQVRKQCCDGNWSAYTESQTFRTLVDPNSSPCDNLVAPNTTTSSITETTAYVYTSRPYGNDKMVQFRHRFVGSLIWNYSDITTSYYRFLSNLEPGTDYEFQVRNECDQGEFTPFSNSKFFTTVASEIGCVDDFGVQLFTSSTSETKSYIYTSQPYGRVDNEFRYRAIGTTAWSTTTTTNNYYRYLTGLSPGTDYEFQVRHNCSGTTWTDWSFSHTFRTLGGAAAECDPIIGDRQYFNAVTTNNAYIYTPQPYGQVANQFRYRAQGSNTWNNTTVSTLYYRYLTNLQPGTTYEFQTAHECVINSWTEWSSSKEFTTASKSSGGIVIGKLLPPLEDPLFHQDMVADLNVEIYPNPSSQVLNFMSSKSFTDQSNIRIIDVTGKVVNQQSLNAGDRQVVINTAGLNDGIYLLHFDNGYETTVQRFVKKN